jgi:nitric oxide dioxygenase
LIDLDWLKSVLSDHQKDFYFCGPLPFLKSINESLKEWGVPAERRHYELFSPVSTIEEE